VVQPQKDTAAHQANTAHNMADPLSRIVEQQQTQAALTLQQAPSLGGVKLFLSLL
jgi:hypothetical protein